MCKGPEVGGNLVYFSVGKPTVTEGLKEETDNAGSVSYDFLINSVGNPSSVLGLKWQPCFSKLKRVISVEWRGWKILVEHLIKGIVVSWREKVRLGRE